MTFTPPEGNTLPDEMLRSQPAEPSPYSVLSQPRPLPTGPNIAMRQDGLPAGALRMDHQRCIQSVPMPNCDPADPDDYPDPATDSGPRFYPVTWTVPVGCASGRMTPEYERWAREDVEAATAFRLERFLWSDASLEDVQGPGTFMPSLMAVAATVGDPDEPMNPRDGLALALADYLGCNEAGGRATVHVPTILGPALFADSQLVAAGTRLQTSTGHAAILGAGYDPLRSPFDNADPSDLDDEADGTAWIVVSGPVHWDVGTSYLTADPWGELRRRSQTRLLTGTVDPRQGKQVVVGARSAMFAFDVCCVRAVKVQVPNLPPEVAA